MQKFNTTGHQKIDVQHLMLEQLIQQLDNVCELREKPGSNCVDCPKEQRATCSNRSAAPFEDLLDFFSEHFSCEDNLMRQLPQTPECAKHVGEHKWAHAEIADQLSEEIDKLDRENPRQSIQRIQNIISASMSDHIANVDVKLSGYLG